ncbi:hypothetical protein BLNAU_14415 [Blattamonas nauphoetae]|uniref:Uncharacterized protein n=1 Tax=Blattamonas nauphoetae TaxID=2049346 RepID=A0ABQ9XGS2_9EUKA|nr:hypothetical protein BLNAU_14415 [Blattamonas nauphoetae]
MGRESSEPAQPLTILGVLVTVCDMFSLLLRGVLQEQHSLLTRAIEALCGQITEKSSDSNLVDNHIDANGVLTIGTLTRLAENVEIQDLVNQKAEDAETKPTAEHPQDASDANDSQTPKRLDSEHSSKDTSAEPESGPAPQHLSCLHSASFSSWIWDAHDPPACERGFAWLIFKPVLAVCIVGESEVIVADFGSE